MLTTADEQWLPLLGFDGYYEISSLGRLKSLKRYVRHNYGGLKLVPERILKPRNARYLNVMACKEGVEYIVYIHQEVAKAFIHNPENKPEVNHIDGDTHNNLVSNLEWNTVFENQVHAIKNGLFRTKGENGKNPYENKNLYETIEGIKEMYASGVPQSEVGRIYDLDQSTVSRIVNNKRWTKLCQYH